MSLSLGEQPREGLEFASLGKKEIYALDEFVARLNIEHLQRKLTEETDENKVRLIARLLAEERAKLAAIEASKKQDNRGLVACFNQFEMIW